jgi:hypothetical protein
MAGLNVNDAHCEALFASPLQQSHPAAVEGSRTRSAAPSSR